MKKVAILSLHLGFGGIEKSVAALANLLSEKYEVEIACTYKLYEKSVFEINDNVKIKYLVPDLKPNREEVKSALRKKNIIKLFKEGIVSVKVLNMRI